MPAADPKERKTLRKSAVKPLESFARVNLWATAKRSGRQAQKSGRARLETEQEPRAGSVPRERADQAAARIARQNFGPVAETGEQNEAVGVADGDDQRLRMKGHLGHPRLTHAALPRGLAHRPVLVLERPDDGGVGAGGRKPLAVVRPGERARLARISGHPHVARILDPPAVQRVLLHRGHEKTSVRREGDVEMRALPFQGLRSSVDLRKPERRAIVMGRGEAKALGLKA